MKKILSLLFSLFFSFISFAQPCNTKEDANNTPTICTKGYEANYKPTAEQEKWMTTIFTSGIKSAIENTKGFKGKWKPMGGYPKTSERFVRSEVEMYMNLLGCKDNKLYEKHESGLVLNFISNSLWSMADPCRHEERKWEGDHMRPTYLDDKIDGKQIYLLNKETAKENSSKFTYYRKESDGEYFVVSKPGVPLFIPLTVKQALVINKQNCLNRIESSKQELQRPFLKSPNNDNAGLIKNANDAIELEKKSIQLIDDYLTSTSAKELEQPCNSIYSDFLYHSFENTSRIKSYLAYNAIDGRAFVVLNPAYFNHTVSIIAPQFIGVVLRTQGDSPVTLKAYYDFRTNLDFEKLRSILVK